MPGGLADQLASRQEFLDLTKFLSVLGRPGEFANDESPVIRKWRVADNDDESAAWIPAYSKVNGELPADDFSIAKTSYAKGALNVQVAGKALLEINDPAGLRLWIDDDEITDLSSSVELEKGRRELTFSIDHKERNQGAGLRVELITPANSSIKFQPEGGL